jgi:glutaredoxin
LDKQGFHEGRAEKKIVLYALSTCIWCRKARELLDRLGLAYRFFYVDLLVGEERRAVEADMEGYNPRGSFPTIVVDGREVIIGFDEARIRSVCDG